MHVGEMLIKFVLLTIVSEFQFLPITQGSAKHELLS